MNQSRFEMRFLNVLAQSSKGVINVRASVQILDQHATAISTFSQHFTITPETTFKEIETTAIKIAQDQASSALLD